MGRVWYILGGVYPGCSRVAYTLGGVYPGVYASLYARVASLCVLYFPVCPGIPPCVCTTLYTPRYTTILPYTRCAVHMTSGMRGAGEQGPGL